MATSITDSFKQLKASLDSLRAQMKGMTGAFGAFYLSRSKGLRNAKSTIDSNAALESGYSDLKKAKDLFRASQAMATGRFKTPERFLQWEKLIRRRRMDEYKRKLYISDRKADIYGDAPLGTIRAEKRKYGISFTEAKLWKEYQKDLTSIVNPKKAEEERLWSKYGDMFYAKKMLSLRRTKKAESLWRQKRMKDYMIYSSVTDMYNRSVDPVGQHRIDLQRKYGKYAQTVEDIETTGRVNEARANRAKARAQGRYQYNLAMMPAMQREHLENVQRFGGGAQGQELASAYEEKQAAARRTRGNHAAKLNAKRIYEEYKLFGMLRETGFGGKTLKKISPKFYKWLGLEEKQIPITAKRLAKIEKMIPGIGKFFRHPVAMAFGAAATVGRLMYDAAKANTSQQFRQSSLSNLQLMAGKPPKEFMEAGFAAGMSPEEINQSWYSNVNKWAIPGMKMPLVGQVLGDIDEGIGRTRMLQYLGLSPAEGALAMKMAGVPLNNEELRSKVRIKKRFEYMGSEDASKNILYAAANMFDSILNNFGYEVYDENGEYRPPISHLFTYPNDGSDPSKKARDAANSAAEYQRNGTGSTTNNTSNTSNKQTSITISNLSVNANDPQGLIRALEQEADKVSGREMTAKYFDTTMVA